MCQALGKVQYWVILLSQKRQVGTNLLLVIILPINLPFVCFVFLCLAHSIPIHSLLSSAEGPMDHIQFDTGRGYFPAEVQLLTSTVWFPADAQNESHYFNYP